jgi:outer membrane protein OmpA-like peptidoglycan-associated protein
VSLGTGWKTGAENSVDEPEHKHAMKHIDLVGALESAFSQPVLEQLAGKFGLSSDILRRVVDCAAPTLVLALMAAGASRQRNAELFAVIMSPQVNPRVELQFQELAATTAGLKALEDVGQSFVREGMSAAPGNLCDLVATNSGIPVQAAYAMTCVIASMLAGVLKHHVLLEQGSADGLPQLLAGQWPSVGAHLADGLAQVLRFDDAAAFRDTVPAQLRVLSGSLQRTGSTPAEGTKRVADNEPATKAMPVPERPAKSGRRRRVAATLLVVAASAGAVVYGVQHFPRAQPRAVPRVNGSGQTIPSAAASSASSASSALAAASEAGVAASTPAAMASAAVANVVMASGTGASGGAAAPASAVASDTEAASSPEGASRVSTDSTAHASHLGFAVDRLGAAIVSASVASDAQRNQLLSTLDRRLGAGHYTADVTIDNDVAPADWLTHVEALVPLMRVVRADMTLDGQNIELGGTAAQPGSDWASRVRNIFGPGYHVQVFDSAQAVSTATAAFRVAVNSQLKSGACRSVDRVLNLQVVDFAHDSGHVPATAMDNLKATAQLLNACAARGQTVTLIIKSFSDNTGNAKANLDLSTKRAEAVRLFLVQAGAPVGSLSSQGYGVALPVADNRTERGRFANRRIVFVPRS